jgi:hypothetical protein
VVVLSDRAVRISLGPQSVGFAEWGVGKLAGWA